MPTTIRYILITALRDRLFLALVLALMAITAISSLLGSTAFLESQQMTMVLSSGAARLILMIGLMIFVCFHTHHMFDSKEIEMMLSRPLSRTKLLFHFWLGFASVGFILSMMIGIVIAIIGPHGWAGYAFWTLSLMMEAMLIIAMAIFASFALGNAVLSVMASMGMYLVARMMAFFVMTAQSGLGTTGNWAPLEYVLQAIAILVPRLDMFTQSQWLIYGMDDMMAFWHILLQTIIFIPILLIAAMLDFRRREF